MRPNKPKTLVAATLAALIGSVLVAVATPAAADSGPVQMPGTNHWYRYVSSPATWTDARAAAETSSYQGVTGHLVTITSAEENRFVGDLASGIEAWIGARDTGAANGYTRNYGWVAGPESGVVMTSCPGSSGHPSECSYPSGRFTAWHTDEPNGNGGDIVAVKTNYLTPYAWDDTGVREQHPYVVEFDLKTPVLTGTRAVQVVTGYQHSCALLSTGKVRCWGSSAGNQADVPADLPPMAQIAAGGMFTCGLDRDGLVHCWGSEEHYGGPTGVLEIPTTLPLGVNIMAGDRFACIIDASQRPHCWGDRGWGNPQYHHLDGLEAQSEVVQAGGWSHDTCAVLADHRLGCWGVDFFNSMDFPGSLNDGPGGGGNVRMVTVGWVHGCAVTLHDDLVCWGSSTDWWNASTWVGAGAYVPPALGKVLDVDAGGANTCAVSTGHSVFCWGSNDAGQNDVPGDLPPALQVSIAGSHACAVLVSGSVRCWGANGLGQSAVPADLLAASEPPVIPEVPAFPADATGIPLEDYRTTATFTAPESAWYFFQALGAGGSGGTGGVGWSIGGGGGGGAYASGWKYLDKDSSVAVTVGRGGVTSPGAWVDGSPGGETRLQFVDGDRLIAGGGRAGASGGSGGGGGSWSASSGVTRAVGFAGGRGGEALITPSFWGGFHQGGEGGSAANSSGPGRTGTSQRCVWAASAVHGDLPAGRGGMGFYDGYDGHGYGANRNCGVDFDGSVVDYLWDAPAWLRMAGAEFGAGGGGSKEIEHSGSGGGGFVRVSIAKRVTAPSAPPAVAATAGDAQATVSWTAPTADGGSPITGYTATASPGGQSCSVDAPATTCIVTGLNNRIRYTFAATATNAAGTSEPSQRSSIVTPLSPGFQAWTDDQVLSVGSSTTLRFGNSAPSATITVTGGLKATVPARSDGFAEVGITATRTGVIMVTGSYIVKAGKKATKYTTKTSVYSPKCSGPLPNVKSGKSGSFKVLYAPPGASVSVTFDDGRVVSATADAAGKASLIAVFATPGNYAYTVEVSGVSVANGSFSVVR